MHYLQIDPFGSVFCWLYHVHAMDWNRTVRKYIRNRYCVAASCINTITIKGKMQVKVVKVIQSLQVIQSIQVIQIIQAIQKVQVRLTYLGVNFLCFFLFVFWDELMNCLKRFEAKLISVWEGNASHSSFGLLMSNFAKEEEDLEFVKSLISKQMSLLLILTMEREKLSENF